MYEPSQSRCNELAALPELRVHHFEELTGVAICEGGSFAVSQAGVFPEQHSDRDLRLLFPEERRLILDEATRPPLLFPCSPRQLVDFVSDTSWYFDLPDGFIVVVAAQDSAIDGPFIRRKRAALIADLLSIWPSIERDLKDASRNGLSANKLPGGFWNADESILWAVERGKIKKQKASSFVSANSESEFVAVLRQAFAF